MHPAIVRDRHTRFVGQNITRSFVSKIRVDGKYYYFLRMGADKPRVQAVFHFETGWLHSTIVWLCCEHPSLTSHQAFARAGRPIAICVSALPPFPPNPQPPTPTCMLQPSCLLSSPLLPPALQPRQLLTPNPFPTSPTLNITSVVTVSSAPHPSQ